MTNEKILKKAIRKAIENGFWKNPDYLDIEIDFDLCPQIKIEGQFNVATPEEHGDSVPYLDYRLLIFSHDFAKAFWGEFRIKVQDSTGETLRIVYSMKDVPVGGRFEGVHGWQWHLQKMVLEEEPLKYLEGFL